MEEKIWEFEGDWYVQADGFLPLCANSKEAAEMLLEFIEMKRPEILREWERKRATLLTSKGML